MTAGEETESARTRQLAGIRTFAGVLMLVIGGYHAMAGIAALREDEIFVETPSYTYALDVTTWGWVQLGLGVLVALAGAAVLRDRLWGRLVGILLAGLSLFANFLFLLYYPLWAALIIAFDVVLIWALAAYRPESV
ncbi:DUF7144 family membrane protein [Pseudonocardia cypriaca]|uniref:DUF7144 domain-containing protein n=1 Tax=Pseudonocardia cypriaca TaxID=882449 RepID=A0A543GFP2_9PSEU|nr:hypothetical protein [Pseudonocardia cypriaca]TQM44866.1 hypothetical protein FB388_2252 [Pseudonocardia cypriaca]